MNTTVGSTEWGESTLLTLVVTPTTHSPLSC
jgi:hypothetical protein